jgi:probable rRNA maturation factor
MKVNVLSLQKKIPIGARLSAKIKKVVRDTVAAEQRGLPREVSICLVDNKMIKRLNRKYFGKACATDVISFATGDMAVSAETAVSNAALFQSTPLYELMLYVAHGTLHAIGYEDKTARGRKLMQSKAERALKKSGYHVHP